MNQHQSRSFWKGKGFYLALTLVVAGAAMASFLAINTMMNKLQTESTSQPLDGEETTSWDTAQKPVDTKKEDVPVAPASSSAAQSTAASQPPASSAPSESTVPVEQPAPQTPPYVSPLSGKTLQAFSGDELVYNETLKDWRTHNGLDITGGENTGIHAPMNATVQKVSAEDPRWGGVVELSDGSLTVRLCGLKEIRVKEGDAVEQGKTIAQLAEVPCESALAGHLHVECEKDGKLVDPASYFG